MNITSHNILYTLYYLFDHEIFKMDDSGPQLHTFNDSNNNE